MENVQQAIKFPKHLEANKLVQNSYQHAQQCANNKLPYHTPLLMENYLHTNDM